MKKGHYIKQDADELLTGEISNEDCAVFKAYYQLKAMCFKKELKDSYMTFKQAVRVYGEEVINVLIDEEYVFRIIEDGLDYLLIPSITDNVKGMTDYSLQNSIIGKTVSYTHLRAHETDSYLVCRLLLEKKGRAGVCSEWGGRVVLVGIVGWVVFEA